MSVYLTLYKAARRKNGAQWTSVGQLIRALSKAPKTMSVMIPCDDDVEEVQKVEIDYGMYADGTGVVVILGCDRDV